MYLQTHILAPRLDSNMVMRFWPTRQNPLGATWADDYLVGESAGECGAFGCLQVKAMGVS
jgi:hypothetical protein